jgi:hypothetical protein
MLLPICAAHNHITVPPAVGWTLFALSTVALCVLAKALVAGVMLCVRCWLIGASALMIATQLVRWARVEGGMAGVVVGSARRA